MDAGIQNRVRFVLAGFDEASEILNLFQGLARWLHEKGVRQWGYFLTPMGRAIIEKRFQQGEVWWLLVDGAKAGIVCASLEDDFWADQGADPNSIYVHTLGVKREYAGLGLGSLALQWCAAWALKRGRSRLRLDCGADNPRLCSYYEAKGFARIGGQVWQGWELNLYEKTLAESR
jgi:GNAT superfamily N-acetyltransferase